MSQYDMGSAAGGRAAEVGGSVLLNLLVALSCALLVVTLPPLNAR